MNNVVRSVSEMPDHEGSNWFVTDVAGAPYQLLGLRGSTGELFALTLRTRGALTLNRLSLEATGVVFEVITGPEAECLITGFMRQLGYDAVSGTWMTYDLSSDTWLTYDFRDDLWRS